LDPSSRAFSESGTVSGKVLSYYEPFGAIAGALVSVQSTGASTLTNSSGAFLIAGVPAGKTSLIVSRAGYRNDTVAVDINIGYEIKITSHLDALPLVGSCQVVTRKIDQWWPRAVYSALVSGAVTDPDGLGDISGATLQVDTMKFQMSYVPDLQSYQATINASILPQGNLEWLVGKAFSVIGRDKVGAATTGKSFFVSRIIQDAPIPLYPTALDTATATPELYWAQPTLQFSYTLKLEMYRLDQGLPSLIWSLSNLPPALSSYQYPDRLPVGTFFWTISVIDEYGNLSRSKEASFVIQEPVL
jgi:hypothetical protein